jgi:tetratricopeptide (TPR) repeat protein
LYAETNLKQDKFKEAMDIINNALAVSPNEILFYMKARICIQLEEFEEAEKSIKIAIEFDPNDADYIACYANIKMALAQFNEALELANDALRHDSENILALNVRSSALLKLNRKEESYDTIENALREDPNNAFTHANYGWNLLEKGHYEKAQEHFKISLTIDPTSTFAQEGLLESIKATNFFYRQYLRYSFFLQNQSTNIQWTVIIGVYIVMRVLRVIASKNEMLRPYLIPIIIVLALAAFSTWIIQPIGNLFLRFNKYGKMLLSKEEKISSTLVASSFGLGLIGLLLYVITKQENYLPMTIYGISLMLPLSTIFISTSKAKLLRIYIISLAGIGFIGMTIPFISGNVFNAFGVIYILGFVGFQWVANLIRK